MNRKKILGLLIAVAVVSIPLHAATVYVDIGDGSCDDQGTGTMQVPFCSIQAGYDSTVDLDELRVMPGTYGECLFLYDLDTQKGVSVVADAYVNSGNKDVTTIDGTGLDCVFPVTGAAASVVNLGGSGGKLEGFTVTGAANSAIFGVGPVVITNNVVSGNDSAFGGGGIYVYTATCYYGDSTAEVSFNEVTNNRAAGDGGGIAVTAGQLGAACAIDGNASVTIEGNSITDNVADGSGGGILAAAYTALSTLSAEIVITSNTITDNSASSQELLGQGGGLFAYTYGSGTESITAMANTIANNSTLDYGGGASLWIDPDNNNTNLNHEIVFTQNTVTGNEAGFGGGGVDVLVRTPDFRINQRAEIQVLDNAITGNVLTADLPDQTFGGGGVLVFSDSRNSNSPRMGMLLEGNDISNNSAFGFGGGVSIFATAISNPANDPGAETVYTDVELRSNEITRNDSSTNAQGWDGAAGGVFMLLETEGDASARVDMPLNTIADNTIDTMNEVGGIHAESFISPDAAQNEGEAILNLNSSIVTANDGVGFGGPSPGLPGYVSPGGSDNFVVTMTYTDLFGNEAGDLDSWIPAGGTGNIFEDPLLAALTYEPAQCSPTIDAADPAINYSLEAQPNGGVANMGHTGGTDSAVTGHSAIDINGDGYVDGIEVLRIATSFGSMLGMGHYLLAADLNRDDMVDGEDLAFVSTLFGETCE